MSDNTIFVKRYHSDDERLTHINQREIWRYSGYLGIPSEEEAELNRTLEQVILELKDAFSYKVCYRRMDITWQGDMPILPFLSDSKDLAKALKGSREVILFAATIGLELDRKIARYQRIAATKALLMQAYGAERIECLCDCFCKEISDEVKQEGLACTPRFSPGYGDLPLEKQIDFFELLDCNRQIGVSLNDSLLMTPSKSVTAIFGIGTCVGAAVEQKCLTCRKTDCEFRRGQ